MYISIRSKILKVLVENEKRFLPIELIAKRVFGEFPNSQFKKLGIKQVKRNMAHAIELGAQEGLMIIAKKQPMKKDELRRFKIVGYKIAEHSDEQYIKESIANKSEKSQIYIESLNLFSSRIVENKLLPIDELIKLEQ